MKVISKKQASYGVYKVGSKHRVVRNIRDYGDPKEATRAALLLARGDITEDEVRSEDNKE